MLKFVLTFFITIPVWSTSFGQKIKPDTLTLNDGRDISIGFGSCFDQNQDYSIWNDIYSDSLDLWIWLGDNIYSDTPFEDSMRIKYNKLKNSNEYDRIRKSIPIIGTWDDHDYGANDAGEELKSKELSKKAALDFMDVPDSSTRRQHKGIYGSYVLKNRSIRVILLDLRYFKESPTKEHASILGKKQWQWLKNELKKSTENYNIICSSLQVISNEHRWENWQKYGNQRNKFLNMIQKYKPNGTVILSGDRHRAEVSIYKTHKMSLLEFTSSSLNSPGSCSEEQNSHRIGSVICGVPIYAIFHIKKDVNELSIEFKNQNGTLQNWNLKANGFEK